MVEGCLDDHDIDRGGSLLDDMDEALASESGLLLEAGPSDLCDMHDPDLDESNRAIRYSHNNYTQRKIYSTEMFLRLCFFVPLKAPPPATTFLWCELSSLSNTQRGRAAMWWKRAGWSITPARTLWYIFLFMFNSLFTSPHSCCGCCLTWSKQLAPSGFFVCLFCFRSVHWFGSYQALPQS